MAVFPPTSLKVSVQKVLLCPFHCKPRPSGVSLEYAEVENIPPSSGKSRPSSSKSRCAQGGPGYSFSLKVKLRLYFGPEARKYAFKNFFCFRFTANHGHQELVQSPRDWKIFPKFREIEQMLIKITMRVTRSRLLFQS